MDCGLPASSVPGMPQARTLGWAAISFSRGSSDPGMEPPCPAWQAGSLPLSHQENPLLLPESTQIPPPAHQLPTPTDHTPQLCLGFLPDPAPARFPSRHPTTWASAHLPPPRSPGSRCGEALGARHPCPLLMNPRALSPHPSPGPLPSAQKFRVGARSSWHHLS